MTRLKAYNELTAKHVHWGRKDAEHIYIWTQGYKCHDHVVIEKYLMQAGFRMVAEDFDSICGKTRAIYKHSTKAERV